MSDRRKQPLDKGVAKVPVVMQMEALECGAACLTMILAYYGKWISLEQIRRDCGVSKDSSNAKNILVAARYHGLIAQGFRCDPDAFREKGTYPCIIHWNFNHFVVMNGIKGDKVYLNDPAKGTYAVDWATFDTSFTGICLQFSPGTEFVPSGKPRSVLGFAKKRLEGTGPAIAFAALTSVIAAVLSAVSPVFSQVFLDRLLTGQNPGWLMPYILLLGGFNLIQIVMSALQSVYDLRLNGKMSAVGNASYMWKVLHLPMEFFSQRLSGDIQARQGANAEIANSLIGTLAPLLLNAVMMVFYLVLMIRYSWVLTLVGITSLTLNTLVSNYLSQKRVNLTRVSMQDQAKLYSATTAGIELIETIKASGAENGYFAKWAGYQANVNANNVRSLKLSQYLGAAAQLVSVLADNAVLFLGVWFIMQGEFTVGMIMAFQSFLSAFMSPALSMVSAGQTLQEMRTQMERVEDVMEYPCDNPFRQSETASEEYRKLSGSIEIRDLEFGYSPLAAPLIQNFSLKLEPGKCVAIVGASGCGKSTISKLISGLYKPWQGTILFDGKPMESIDKNVFYGSLAVVDQDIILFEDTIANNIKMWDSSIEDFEMILAARDAQIHEDIMARPKGYQHRLTEGGRDFSGGQRQRMEIARVLAQDPTVIILDEATSALDNVTQKKVSEAIEKLKCTRIVIAHRLSTIRHCDRIIVLDKGRIVEEGTYEALIAQGGFFADLVARQRLES